MNQIHIEDTPEMINLISGHHHAVAIARWHEHRLAFARLLGLSLASPYENPNLIEVTMPGREGSFTVEANQEEDNFLEIRATKNICPALARALYRLMRDICFNMSAIIAEMCPSVGLGHIVRNDLQLAFVLEFKKAEEYIDLDFPAYVAVCQVGRVYGESLAKINEAAQ